ncbi:hypothetical protein QFZ49_000286 [Streptomyces turgidiscabies]|uniref:Uncharacterized protein n=1 Tax=Streptomyces turgidiscabies TaxID=85558 RepID=A0ABU0REG4_9ACTN|nr:hypothetical protein [Streptomyces turgidiscabies]
MAGRILTPPHTPPPPSSEAAAPHRSANASTSKKNNAYAGSSVSLQFRAKNATTFKTLKKVTTNSAGALRTTVTASTDGFFRWVYYGNTTTGTATSGQDYIDVR